MTANRLRRRSCQVACVSNIIVVLWLESESGEGGLVTFTFIMGWEAGPAKWLASASSLLFSSSLLLFSSSSLLLYCPNHQNNKTVSVNNANLGVIMVGTSLGVIFNVYCMIIVVTSPLMFNVHGHLSCRGENVVVIRREADGSNCALVLVISFFLLFYRPFYPHFFYWWSAFLFFFYWWSARMFSSNYGH